MHMIAFFSAAGRSSVDEESDDNNADDEDLQLGGREGGHTQVPEVEIVINFLF